MELEAKKLEFAGFEESVQEEEGLEWYFLEMGKGMRRQRRNFGKRRRLRNFGKRRNSRQRRKWRNCRERRNSWQRKNFGERRTFGQRRNIEIG